MRIALQNATIGLRNSTARIPFRYGKACLSRCPQLMLQVTAQIPGATSAGTSADCLPPGWFDKRPGRDFQQQINEMLEMIRVAEGCFLDAFRQPAEFFPTWRECYQQVHDEAKARDATPLLASFAVSLFERAMLDASCRGMGLSFHQALRQNIWSLEGKLFPQQPELKSPVAWLPERPLEEIYVRHTVGLADPLTSVDLAGDSDACPDDGLPVTLEDYIDGQGLRFLKIKVSNRLSDDLARLQTIAHLIEDKRGADYRVTLDGNEQYETMDSVMELINAIRSDPALATLWQNVLVIEQPLQHETALDSSVATTLRDLARHKPVIIDESDGTLDAFVRAAEVGYRGTSMKNCKGPIKAIYNRALIDSWNRDDRQSEFVMTAEDLCSVGVVAVQSDLCLAAALGIEHVERNGHHFHSGLSYLPTEVQQLARRDHPDFYAEHPQYVGPRLQNGRFRIASLQTAGFGFRSVPDIRHFIPIDDWTYDSLGIES